MTAAPSRTQPATEQFPNEEVLPDDYPVYYGYAYVADGEPIISLIKGTVCRLKKSQGYQEVRRCNIYARKAAKEPR